MASASSLCLEIESGICLKIIRHLSEILSSAVSENSWHLLLVYVCKLHLEFVKTTWHHFATLRPQENKGIPKCILFLYPLHHAAQYIQHFQGA